MKMTRNLSAGIAAVCLAAFGGGCAAPEAREASGSTSAAHSAPDAPEMVYPQEGQVLGLSGSYMFKVTPTDGSTGTLCSLWQDDQPIWENLASDGTLGENGECAIHADHPLHRSFKAGPVKFMARDLVGGQWTEAREIALELANPAPELEYPANGQTLAHGGSYMFKLKDSAGTDGALCSIWQDGQVLWENLANDGAMGESGECGIHPDHPLHASIQAGSAKFMGRYLVHGEWSDAVEIDLVIE
jgi:hypothetical protein